MEADHQSRLRADHHGTTNTGSFFEVLVPLPILLKHRHPMERPNHLTTGSPRLLGALIVVCFWAVSQPPICSAQQLEPRRWSHLPVDVSFASTAYAYTDADISFDPVLRIENATMEMHSFPVKYIRTFELAGKSARIDWTQAYQHACWSGLLNGASASTAREGWSDMVFRLAVDLVGAPPLKGKEFVKYRATTDSETIVGVGLAVELPTGHYLEDKLLNLGSNRFTFRPQFGVVHNRGKLAMEVTAASWIYTDNHDFFDGSLREEAPLFTVQGHLDYTFRPGLWVGAGVGYGQGGESTLNGINKNDERKILAWVLNFGYPLTKKWGVKLSYVGKRTQTAIGANSDTLVASTTVLW